MLWEGLLVVLTGLGAADSAGLSLREAPVEPRSGADLHLEEAIGPAPLDAALDFSGSDARSPADPCLDRLADRSALRDSPAVSRARSGLRRSSDSQPRGSSVTVRIAPRAEAGPGAGVRAVGVSRGPAAERGALPARAVDVRFALEASVAPGAEARFAGAIFPAASGRAFVGDFPGAPQQILRGHSARAWASPAHSCAAHPCGAHAHLSLSGESRRPCRGDVCAERAGECAVAGPATDSTSAFLGRAFRAAAARTSFPEFALSSNELQSSAAELTKLTPVRRAREDAPSTGESTARLEQAGREGPGHRPNPGPARSVRSDSTERGKAGDFAIAFASPPAKLVVPAFRASIRAAAVQVGRVDSARTIQRLFAFTRQGWLSQIQGLASSSPRCAS